MEHFAQLREEIKALRSQNTQMREALEALVAAFDAGELTWTDKGMAVTGSYGAIGNARAALRAANGDSQ